MSSDNILTEFALFIEKSAAVMMGMQQPPPPLPPAATAISATPTPAPSNVATQAQALVTPPVSAPAPPRTAAVPTGDSALPAAKPKPVTNTSKTMKHTNFNPSSKS